jgi:hypothetical protein
VKTEYNLAGSFKEGCGSKRAATAMMIIMKTSAVCYEGKEFPPAYV